jgi:large subunit ribosomal protein L21
MSKFAVIETGGKQYRVSEGDIITIEKIKGEYKEGDKIAFETILLINDGDDLKIGTPNLSDAKVEGELVGQGLGKKVSVIRYKAKSRYFKKKGHRQPYMKVKISKIS